jgi:hypothetical protein
MIKKFDLLLANLLFILHILVGGIILFGWIFPQIRILYLAVLVIWPLCWIILKYCPLTQWEFLLRRKYDKNVDYHSEYINYYVSKFFNVDIPINKIFFWGLVFDITSIILNILFYGLHKF